MNLLRKELTEFLATVDLYRKPALRRSRKRCFLYATDAPQVMTEEQLSSLIEQLEKRGWQVSRDGGWLQLDKAVTAPPSGWFEGPFGPEAACCRSLLERHGAQTNPAAIPEDARDTVRLLLKAGEEGAQAMENCCANLHALWAERLRNRQPLPPVPLSFWLKTETDMVTEQHQAKLEGGMGK